MGTPKIIIVAALASVIASACSASSGSSSTRHTSTSTVVNGSLGDQTTSEWLGVLAWIGHRGPLVAPNSSTGTRPGKITLHAAQRRAPLLLRVTVWSPVPFVINEVDKHGVQSLLLSQYGPYDGTTVANIDGTDVALTIQASGKWAMRLSDLRSARSFTGSVHGKNDEVLLYRGAAPDALHELPRQLRLHRDVLRTGRHRRPHGRRVRKLRRRRARRPGDAVVVVESAGKWTVKAS